jgi:GTP-binding protein Era
MSHKSGFVNIIGNPNVGKSTFLNAILGQKLAITTPKAQTTRHRILGILNGDDYQMIFSDTPGIIKPAYKMHEAMMGFVKEALQDADVIIYMVDVNETQIKDESVLKFLQNTKIPVFLLINKIDTVNQEKVEAAAQHWKSLLPNARIFPVSALHAFNVKELIDQIKQELPESPPFYSKDTLTDKSERFFVEEMIREKILLFYKKEIPYSVEVKVEEFKDEPEIVKIRATIYVIRPSQKGIIIGHQGERIKRVGTEARKDIETFLGKKVFLDLHVKVKKDWRDNDNLLKQFGYK